MYKCCSWKFFPIQHLTYKICIKTAISSLLTAMPGVSIHVIAWPPHLLGQVVLHNSQQQSPIPCPLHDQYMPGFICCCLHPALRDHFLDPKSLNPLPWPWEGEILKQLPGGRWWSLFSWCDSQQVLHGWIGIIGAASPAAGPPHGSHVQCSNCSLVTERGKANPWVTESSSSCYPKLYL